MIDKEESQSSEIATSKEIRDAYEAFTFIEASRLKNFAQAKEPWGDKYFDYQDLINEAYVLTVDATRPWRKSERSFLKHMFNVVKSLASHWKREYPELKKKDADHRKWVKGKLACKLTTRKIESVVTDAQTNPKPQLTKEEDPIQNLSDKGVGSPEKQIIYEQEVGATYDKIEAFFANDEEALLIIWGLSEGNSRKGLQTELGIDDKQFYTIRRRILRGVEKLKEGELSHE